MDEDLAISAKRLRIGMVCLLLWWAPFWALAPKIANTLGGSTSIITAIIITIQTIIGLIGFWIVGKPITKIIKKLPFRKVPGQIIYMIIHGKEKE